MGSNSMAIATIKINVGEVDDEAVGVDEMGLLHVAHLTVQMLSL